MLSSWRNIRSGLLCGGIGNTPCNALPRLHSRGTSWVGHGYSASPSPIRMIASTCFPDESSALKSCSMKDRMKWHPIELCGIRLELHDSPGELLKALQLFSNHNLNLTRVEHRPQPLSVTRQSFTLYFEGNSDGEEVLQVMEEIASACDTKVHRVLTPEVPWFPSTLSDIDQFSQSTLDAGAELTSDHPGFNDQTYRSRRQEIVSLASEYKAGDTIPPVQYTDDEVACWECVYDKLRMLCLKHGCAEYNQELVGLEKAGIYSPKRIPQLQEVSEYLQQKTGFRLRPVTGLLSGRDFLNALALRVFFSTQYIRHTSTPLYTPEPDVVHELMGHVPMLANQDFADFSQIVGMASLAATDEQIKMLASCYWFSVEFGLLFQAGCLRAYGAGLLSSFGELQYATSPTNSKVEIRAWDPITAAVQEYPITSYQPVYYAGKSLQDVKEKMLTYCEQLSKPFSLRFDAATHSISTDKPVVPTPISIKF
eukprot:GHVS01029322.1.p1 GENE.GHVS01029322.1~~GHVS01029322.1.p1  ORF type:complete len:508 (+),score=48.94 GHVS01029322.1:83-1525(+)